MKKKFSISIKDTKKLIIGIVSFVALVIGASFAYYSVTSNNYAISSNITANSATPGSVTLVNGDNMYLNLTNKDMSFIEEGKTFYATNDQNTGRSDAFNNVILAKANVTGEGTMSCNYTMTVKRTISSDIYDAYKAWSNSSKANGQIALEFSDGFTTHTYDFNTTIGFPLTINGTINNITKYAPGLITGNMYVKNLEGVEQDFLSNKSFGLDIDFTNFSCSLQGSTPTPLYTKLINTGQMWQSGLTEDGSRYVGANPSNYVCFGTDNKTECLNDKNLYLYRVIGVFGNDANSYAKQYVKLIKYSALSYTFSYSDNYRADIPYSESDIAVDINNKYFYRSTDKYTFFKNSNWSEKITNWLWNETDSKFLDGGTNYTKMTSREIYLHELNKSNKTITVGRWATAENYIGLMYVSDFALSLGAPSLSYISENNSSEYLNSWMLLKNNACESLGCYWEWTISRADWSGNTINRIYEIDADDGDFDYSDSPDFLRIRPVFYLKTGTLYKSGTGTITDPYILYK